jgi:hypothetical protein
MATLLMHLAVPGYEVLRHLHLYRCGPGRSQLCASIWLSLAAR